MLVFALTHEGNVRTILRDRAPVADVKAKCCGVELQDFFHFLRSVLRVTS